MGAGICVFRNPETLSSVEHHAEYIIRKGSKDLGSHTVEGSRPGMAILVHSGLQIIGRQGYELLIDQGIDKARSFADMIKQADDFELVTEPELNILTYRYLPADIQQTLLTAKEDSRREANQLINLLTKSMQKTQRGLGRSFVSRTRLNPVRYQRDPIVVFRAVLANPLTTTEILREMLEEQREIAARPAMQAQLKDAREVLGLI
jgi:glutamate decarboxylase